MYIWYMFQRCYSILHDCLSIRKHQQFLMILSSKALQDQKCLLCVWFLVCTATCCCLQSSTVFNRLVEYGYDGLKRQLTAENILSGPTRLKQIMSDLFVFTIPWNRFVLKHLPTKTFHWFKQLQCHWSYSPLLQSFWNQSTCFLHFVCLISLRCWAKG